MLLHATYVVPFNWRIFLLCKADQIFFDALPYFSRLFFQTLMHLLPWATSIWYSVEWGYKYHMLSGEEVFKHKAFHRNIHEM
ncbi:hypothetical protein CANARDRAFT_27571 [[Candida] arabinofermentans NRRL YB-2248]|uniref:Uncharacterized protein n=1 Tax=[Candida] arabinofermentans NRRL YB-2248 TaxID=983967 RepID=A0A1E4T3J6_9ASCO|nr:hypothetical protein CANARDRAFT_27571 [[Candida] arabinofermentans NRRL YB-2248]